MQLVSPADDGLIAKMKEMEAGNTGVPWVKLAQMEDKKQACYDAYTGGEDNRLLRAWEYTVTALCEKGDRSTTTKKMNAASKDLLGTKMGAAYQAAAKETKIKEKDLRKLADPLWKEYLKLWNEKTSNGYDASIRSDASADGSSSRGAHYLYDTAGISDPTRWIKIDDQKKYQVLVTGLIMNAWANLYGSEKNKKIKEATRDIADKMAAELSKESFAAEAKQKVKERAGKDCNLPWERVGGGFSDDVMGIYEERPVTVTPLGSGAPTDAEDLMGRVGGALKALWSDPSTGLKAQGDADPENTSINAANKGVHAFSLSPGEPKLKAMLDDPRGIDVCLTEFKAAEAAKWAQETAKIVKNEREVCEAVCLTAYPRGVRDSTVTAVLNRARSQVSGGGMTHKNATDALAFVLTDRGMDATKVENVKAQAIVGTVVPAIKPADLEKKLQMLAAAAGIPEDLVGLVVETAKTALDKKDPAQADVNDIQAEFRTAMGAVGLDGSSADYKTVVAALNDPAGMIFADSNWGDAEHRVKFAMVVNPLSGELEMWRMNEDGSGASKMDQSKWVNKPWSTVI